MDLNIRARKNYVFSGIVLIFLSSGILILATVLMARFFSVDIDWVYDDPSLMFVIYLWLYFVAIVLGISAIRLFIHSRIELKEIQLDNFSRIFRILIPIAYDANCDAALCLVKYASDDKEGIANAAIVPLSYFIGEEAEKMRDAFNEDNTPKTRTVFTVRIEKLGEKKILRLVDKNEQH